MPENERLVVAPSPRRRSLRIARKGMPSNEISTERTKSNLVKAPKEMPLKEKLREAPTPSVTKSNPVCKKELMPMKERCEETPSVTIKKPKKMESFDTMVSRNNYNMALGDAKIGLELYQKKNKDDAEFEVVRVLFLEKSGLAHSDWKSPQDWSHVSFTAKPKNSNVSPKHFLVEMFYDRRTAKWNAVYCDTFEPSDKPGLKHDCLICGDRRITHPVRGDYVIGAPPYKISGLVFSGIKTGK